MADINYPQRWLNEQNADTTNTGWYSPTTYELLKCQKELDYDPINVQQVFIIVPNYVDVGTSISHSMKFLPRVATELDYDLTVSDTSICVINAETNMLDFLKAGRVSITATMRSGGATVAREIEVRQSASSVTIKEGNTFVYGVAKEVTFELNPVETTEKILSVEMWNNNNIQINGDETDTNKYEIKCNVQGSFDLRVVTDVSSYKVKIYSIADGTQIVETLNIDTKSFYDFNETIYINPTFVPPTASLKDYTVLIENTEIAKWFSGKNAIITNNVNGTTKVTIQMINGIAKFDFDLKVVDVSSIIPLEDITLVLPNSLAMEEEKELSVQLSPNNATVDDLSITSTPEASIRFDGGKWYVKGESVGEATVTVSSASNNITKSYNVQVTPLLVSSFTFSAIPGVLLVGEEHEVTVIPNPSNASDKTFTLEGSANVEITTIVPNNKFKYKAISDTPSTGFLKAIANDIGAITSQKNFTVEPVLVTEINFSTTPANVLVGLMNEVTVSVVPTNATNKSFTMTSSANLKLTDLGNNKYSYEALTTGPAELKAVASDASATTKTVSLQVDPILVSAINFTSDNTSGDIVVGDTHTLTVAVTPNNATNKSYSITASANIELVETGPNAYTYKALSSTPSSGSITATASDASGITRTSNYTIKDPIVLVSSIDLNLPTESDIAATHNLVELITVNPSNATDKTYTTSIVSGPGSIDGDNILSFTATGTVQVKVKANDSGSAEVTKDILVTETTGE